MINQGTVEVKDVKYEVIQEVFRYIYTGKINAEKYCIEGLEELCEDEICGLITFNNALPYLNFSIMNNVQKLKTSAIKCILLYLEVLVDKQEFKICGIQHPELLVEIMRKIYQKLI